MNKSNLEYFSEWFSSYCRSFYSSDEKVQKNITLKEKHSFDVCSNILQIADKLSLDDNSRLLAETTALFHDVGRFPQYARYKTFVDRNSVNHGVLGANVIREEEILKNLSEREQNIIIKSVQYHNAFKIPAKEDEEVLFFLKMVRDADKLDIWRVVIEHQEHKKIKEDSTIFLGLPETPDFTEELLPFIYAEQIAPLAKVKSFNDYRLMQLSWVYDLNFNASYKLLMENEYTDRTAKFLPQNEKIRKALTFVNDYIETEIREQRKTSI